MDELNLEGLLARIQTDDPDVRTDAWQSAGAIGAPAMKPLAKLVAEGELEVGRAAKRGMWKIVRTVGAPGACPEKRKATVAALVALLGEGQPTSVRREVLWMISEIAGEEAVGPIAALLEHPELREDARMVLQRIPGDKSLEALHRGLAGAPQGFKTNIAQSLRARGVEVSGLPCQKLVPKKKTEVTPVGR